MAGVILLAFALRLHNISAFSFWTDEALTPLRSSYPIAQILRNEIIIQGVVTKDTHPAFYYLVMHGLRPFLGESDFAYRYPALLFSLLLVPLLYQFGRRLHGRVLGLVAAVLTAVNPLQIWYADEARMYTLLVLLLAGASYALWRALTGSDLRRQLVIYIILAGLGLYTHYTAVFLIAAQSPFWIWLLWQRGQKKLILAAGLIGLLAAIPLIPLTIPRLFTGTEANYFYVSPGTMLRDVVRFFGLGLTVDFTEVGIKVLNVLTLGLLLLGFYAAKGWKQRAFLSSYLLAVVVGLMAGSLLKPMYQGVRHIMAGSPAFILLLAWAIVFAWEKTRQETAVRYLWGSLTVVALFTVIAGPVIALNNLYFRPELYAKDDFRSLIREIEQFAGENDVIVHNNAILLPLQAHYQTRADLAVTAVPRYPTNAVDSEPDLVALVQTYDRIWLVTDPPADGRDANRLVQKWLSAHLNQVAHLEAHSKNGIVQALGFSASSPYVDELPDGSQPLDIVWTDLPALRGFRLDNDQPVHQPTLWFTLFWEAGDPPPAKTYVRFTLQDGDGREWLVKGHPLWPENGQAWPQDGLAQSDYYLNLPPLPPGDYLLSIQPLSGEGEGALGAAQPLGPITIAATEATDTLLKALPNNSQRLRFDNGLQLAGWETADTGVRPGHTLPLTLYWQTETPLSLDDIRYELTVLEANGDSLRQQSDRPGAPWLPELPAHAIVMEPTGLFIRPETEPGEYELRWRLLDGDNVVPGRPYWRPWSTDSVTLGRIQVIPWPMETALPADVIRTDAVFGSAIDLYGYTLTQSPDELELALTWQVQARPDDSYLLFVHLISTENGEIVNQEDRLPGDGLRPTSGWRPGEVINDTINLPIPDGTPPGNYEVWIGFYQPDKNVRLPVMVQSVPQVNDQLLLTTVSLP